MPLATLHLLQLHTSASTLLSALKSDNAVQIILASIPQFHVIRPQTIDTEILNQKWDLLLLLTSKSLSKDKDDHQSSPAAHLSNTQGQHIKHIYTLPVGIPSRILTSYPARNEQLLSTLSSYNRKLTFSLSAAEEAAKTTSQNLELSPDLLAFARDFTRKHGTDQPVTMLNLLHFVPEGGKARYGAYGKAFVEVAGRRGGDAKLVGNVVVGEREGSGSREGRKEGEWWNEFSLVHYPSILAFCDMLAGEDYQEINRRHRLGALSDTVLICTKEVDDGEKAKL